MAMAKIGGGRLRGNWSLPAIVDVDDGKASRSEERKVPIESTSGRAGRSAVAVDDERREGTFGTDVRTRSGFVVDRVGGAILRRRRVSDALSGGQELLIDRGSRRDLEDLLCRAFARSGGKCQERDAVRSRGGVADHDDVRLVDDVQVRDADVRSLDELGRPVGEVGDAQITFGALGQPRIGRERAMIALTKDPVRTCGSFSRLEMKAQSNRRR